VTPHLLDVSSRSLLGILGRSPPVSAYVNAFVGHFSTHNGVPPHWSQSKGVCLLGCSLIAPEGHNSTQLPQPVHFSSSTQTSPSAFLSRASAGQLSSGLQCLQCQHVTGKSKPKPSSFITVILDAEGPNPFSCLNEHTNSHSLHPEHRSTLTKILFIWTNYVSIHESSARCW
jgi:hypothetical protein